MPVPHRILLVEDDLNIQALAKEALEASGFIVEACATAREALIFFRAGPPDLLIIDIGLPDGNGLDVCRDMGLASGSASIPFIFLTARGELKTRLECFRIGARDYIQKPFSIEELLARVRVQLDVKKAHDELSRKNDELELRSRARQDMTDMLIHDLKSPLTSIRGTLELIKDNGMISPADYQNLVDNAGTAAEFMILMLNDLLDVSQAEQAGLRPESAPVEIRPLLVKLKVLFAVKCQRLGIEFGHKAAQDVKTLTTDQNFLFRILVNLISNAIKATKRGGEVGLECESAGGAVRFTVSDRGTGVPDSKKEDIFKKYVSLGGKSLEGGSGIGLAFCRLAACALKGKIWIEDRAGGGSLFILELPQVK